VSFYEAPPFRLLGGVLFSIKRLREAFVSVEQAKAEFENRTGGSYLHV
jgi:hypothetical protein